MFPLIFCPKTGTDPLPEILCIDLHFKTGRRRKSEYCMSPSLMYQRQVPKEMYNKYILSEELFDIKLGGIYDYHCILKCYVSTSILTYMLK
jgi:hypothetical protein